jgi:hypothetical protein
LQLRGKHADRWYLADLGPGHTLVASCPSCKHKATLDVLALEKKLGPFETIEQVRRRVRCSRCGKRGNRLLVVSERR